jgi:hypothetical protein
VVFIHGLRSICRGLRLMLDTTMRSRYAVDDRARNAANDKAGCGALRRPWIRSDSMPWRTIYAWRALGRFLPDFVTG